MVLKEKKTTVADTWLLTVDTNGGTVFYRKESP